MSVKVMSQVIQHYHGAGGEYTLALCLADFANNDGAAIWPAVGTLAHNSRQSARTVQRQLKAMVSCSWLRVVEEGGGAGRATRYRIDPDWLEDPMAWLRQRPGIKSWREPGAGHNPGYLNPESEKGDTGVTVSDPQKGDTGVTLFEEKRVTSETKKGDTAMSPEQLQNHHINKERPIFDQPGCAVPSDGLVDDDRNLADWMFGLVLALHPKHKPPNWRRWCREIRLMRERDAHSPEQIAVLFRWANTHQFWSANILSPGKLREQWDKLVIHRKRENGELRPGAQAAEDDRCIRHTDGRRGRRRVPGIGWLCNDCIDAHERAPHG